MIEVYLLRQAQPAWEPEGKAVDDPVLTELGHKQAAAAAEALQNLKFDRFLVSPTRRSRETAAPLAQIWGCQPDVLDFLEEIRMPTMHGQPEARVRDFFAGARSRPLEEWWEGIPGGESFRDFHLRLTTGLGQLLPELGIEAGPHPSLWQTQHKAARYLIVSHAGTSSVILSHLLGLPPVPWEWERFPLAWAGYAVIANNPAAGAQLWSLEKFNVTHHLNTYYRDHIRR